MTGNLDNMSEDELQDKMKRILDDHKILLNAEAEIVEEEPSELLENPKNKETIN